MAIRSVRLAEPDLIWPAPVATTRSEMNASSVSPERWGHHARVSRHGRHLHSFNCFAQPSNLIDFDEYGIAYAVSYASGEPVRAGDEQVVAKQLHLAAQSVGKQLPAGPVVFRHAVFEGNDGVLARPRSPEPNHFFRGPLGVAGLAENVPAVFGFEEFARCWIEGDGDLGRRLIPGLTDRLKDHFYRFFVGSEVWRESAFIANGGSVPLLLQEGFSVWKTSAPMRNASEKVAAPYAAIMNF